MLGRIGVARLAPRTARWLLAVAVCPSLAACSLSWSGPEPDADGDAERDIDGVVREDGLDVPTPDAEADVAGDAVGDVDAAGDGDADSSDEAGADADADADADSSDEAGADADADADSSDEAGADADADADTGCDPGLTWCHGACMDLSSDANNCGTCDNVCNLPHVVEQVCRYNTCLIGSAGCAPGWLQCGPDVGCETPVDDSNCGTCGLACDGAQWKCCAPATGACSNTYYTPNCGECGNDCGGAMCCYGTCCEADQECCPTHVCAASGTCP